MGRSSFWPRSAHVAALLAVAMLAFATVRSTVMQAPMSALSADLCGMTMGDMDMAASVQAKTAPGKAPKVCEYCAAAAHAPITAAIVRLAPPQMVAWTPEPPTPELGARGPPAVPAKARAPPLIC